MPPLVCIFMQVFLVEALNHIGGLDPGLGVVDIREDIVVLVDGMIGVAHDEDNLVADTLPVWEVEKWKK